MDPTDKILAEALQLPTKQRARIAQELLHSLDDAGEDVGAAEAWDREIERRARDVMDGTAKTVPWEEVEARLTAKLRKR
jgi:putative addiction module component (TIGR02574 family)